MRQRLWLTSFLSLALIGCSDDTVAPRVDSRAGDRSITGDRGAGEARIGDQSTREARAGDARGDAQGTALSATLTGAQEVPPVTTSATGSSTVTVNSAKTQITVVVTFTGLTNITASHIHIGAVGVSGPIIFPLATGTFTSPLTKTLTAADLTPQAAQNITTFAEAVAAVLAGNTYVNIHTTQNPNGEIRGQITAQP